MSWRDQVNQVVTFRGVPFFLTSAERSGGRRVVKHEYPLRDKPFAEDMGRKARSFPVEGHVIGEHYLTDRDALLDALEAPGAGELVHPFHGSRVCMVAQFRVRESANQGGMASFSIDFEETEASPSQPTISVDTVGAVNTSAALARQASFDQFSAAYDVSSQPAWSLDSVSGALSSATAAFYSALSPVIADAQALADFKSQVDAIALQAATLVATPGFLVERLSILFSSLDTLPLGRAGITALLKVYGFDPGLRPPATTASRAKQQANFDALTQLIQQLALFEAALLAPLQTYDNYTDATDTRDSLTALLDAQAEIASDGIYAALMQLRADTVAALPGLDSDLPRLVEFTPALSIPSLVLAQQLYGSTDLEADLVARNDVRYPGFIPGGRTLEILSNG